MSAVKQQGWAMSTPITLTAARGKLYRLADAAADRVLREQCPVWVPGASVPEAEAEVERFLDAHAAANRAWLRVVEIGMRQGVTA